MNLAAVSRVRFMAALLAGVTVCCLAPRSAQAKYETPDLERVPVERLISNLQKRVEAEPNSGHLWLRLARLHAMAYALKTIEVEVNKRRDDEPWFDYEPPFIPFEVRSTTDRQKVKAAKEHLDKAIQMHKKAVELEPGNVVARLGYGWCLQQAGRKKEAIAAYRKTIEQAWSEEKQITEGRMGGRYVTAEAVSYLIPLLDTEKDKEEIAALQKRRERLVLLKSPITPLVIPLRDGLTAADLVDRRAAVVFDADGTGIRRPWTWTAKDAGWLVFDRHGRGEITSALQMFGSVSFNLFWDNGFEALEALDDNGDREISGSELRGLAIWHDRNANGISEPGEVRPVADWGIVALSCKHQRDLAHPDEPEFSPCGVTFRDGRTRPTFDIVLRPRWLTHGAIASPAKDGTCPVGCACGRTTPR